MVNKYKRHTLYAKVKGTDCENYAIGEAVTDDSKRGQELMSGNLIEDLDRQTAYYSSLEDLLLSYPTEVYDKDIVIYDPVIIVDKHIDDRSKSYAIFDIVFEKDAVELTQQDNIRMWLSDYLKYNPSDIVKFRGIKEIFSNLSSRYPYKNISDLIDMTVYAYFEDNNYKRYREAYFSLKQMDMKKVRRK